MEQTPKQAVGYIYVGAEGAGQNANDARAGLESGCRSMGIELTRVTTDHASQTGVRRVELEHVLAETCRSQGLLVVEALSHLGRSAVAVLRVARRLHDANANLVSLAEQIDTTSDGGAFFRTAAALSELEVERERLMSLAPFGFTLADDGQHLVIDPAQQQVVREMVQLQTQGQSNEQIARALNGGIDPEADERPWDADAVGRVLDHIETSRWDYLLRDDE